MKQKLILPILLLFTSCNNNISEKEKTQSQDSSSLSKEIQMYESFIPEEILKGSLMIWRIGSIQWSSDASVLIFPQKNKLTNGNCYYIQFNYSPFYTNLNEEIMRVYSLNI
jgi:hypothetical protein